MDPALQTEVEQAARLPESGPYGEADVDEARRRIEAVYRKRGYNDVVVTPKVAIDDRRRRRASSSPWCPVASSVLTEVVVAGHRPHPPRAVVRALGLEPGTPVDLAQWAQARKRVFDTNVFRQVEVGPRRCRATSPTARAGACAGHRHRVADVALPLRSAVERRRRSRRRRRGRPRSRDLGVVADMQNRNVLGRAFTFGLYGRVERRLHVEQHLSDVSDAVRPGACRPTSSAPRRAGQSFDDGRTDAAARQQIVSIEQRIRRGRAFEVAYGYRLTHEVLDPFDPDDPFLLETHIGRFTSSALLDRRDDPFDATRGWFGSFTVERSASSNRDSDSIKLLGTLYHYQTVGAFTRPRRCASARRSSIRCPSRAVLRRRRRHGARLRRERRRALRTSADRPAAATPS